MPLRRKLAWVAALYFAEGLPFGIAIDNLPVYFRSHGVSLAEIGLLSLLGMPWTLKVFWAPLVDRFGERRDWITAALLVMATCLAVLPTLDPAQPSFWMWTLLLVFTTASATQDIAIDAYTIDLLDPGEEGLANGIRTSAYRIALIAGGGVLVALAGTLGWHAVFWTAAVLFAALAVAARWTPLREGLTTGRDVRLRSALSGWIRRPGAVFVLAFVLLYKLGDASMGPMVKPFWLDRGLTVEEIGFVSTTLGVFASLAGALLGGVLTSRWGIFHALWILGVLQALSNLGYAAVAAADGGRWAIYSASLLESFTGGLGTASFLAFLMHICEKHHAATEYALLSALFGFTRTLAGTASGLGATRLGYASFFALTFALSFCAFPLLPWIRTWIHDRPAEARAAS
jgi:MFS transporter, PAT family, beta-lactamase induction signal transducer AmpG